MRCSLAVLFLKVAGLCLVIQGISSAQDDIETKLGGPHMPTALEVRFLPPYCQAKWKLDTGLLTEGSEELKKWKDTFGGAFTSMHHYCFGLNFLNRANRGMGNKAVLLNWALGEFKYMQGIPADNVLRPDVEYNIGLVLYTQDRIPQAIVQLRKAIQMKRGNERAYLLLSFCYRRLGDRTSAAHALQEGLTRVPESRALRNALEWMNKETAAPDGGGH